MSTGHQSYHKLTLKDYFSNHLIPVAQGPVIPPLEVMNERSDQEIFSVKTEYLHSHTECLEWIPAEIGLDVFGKKENNNKKELNISFEVRENTVLNMKGASSLKDMSIVYTCKFHNCIVHCPCTVCRDQKGNCRKICKQFSCHDCSSQCIEHESVGLARLFNPNNDHLTIVTNKLNFFCRVLYYPGIPLSCEVCTRDVLEHQIFHHVFHLRCKFCRLEARPFEALMDASLNGYKKAVSYFENKDSRTCSYCFLLLANADKRKIHEKTIHVKMESKYKCEKCEKSYTNTNALAYHMKKHSNEPAKFSCIDCGKQYLSVQALSVHREIVHETKEITKLPCSHCDAVFSSESNVNRHMKTVHEHPMNINVDFVPPLKEVPKYHCSDCEEVFNRKDTLKRHKTSVHKIQEFLCTFCSKKFNRKDVLARHTRLIHK